jgi:hypothetical protein
MNPLIIITPIYFIPAPVAPLFTLHSSRDALDLPKSSIDGPLKGKFYKD